MPDPYTPHVNYRLQPRYRRALRRLAEHWRQEGRAPFCWPSKGRRTHASEAAAIRALVEDAFAQRGWELGADEEGTDHDHAG